MIHAAVVIGTIALTSYLALQKARSDLRAERRRSAVLLLLALAIAVATRDMMDRSDFIHTGFTLLTAMVGLGALSALPLAELSRRRPHLVAAGAASAALVIGTVALAAVDSPRRMLWGLNTSDQSILPDDIKAFAQRYSAELSDADCLLVLTNEGVLNYATGLPQCGEFFYAIYAGVPAGDHALADWLHANPQKLAVVETYSVADNIDHKPMRMRLPKVWALIEATMKSKEEIGGRFVATRQTRIPSARGSGRPQRRAQAPAGSEREGR